MPGVRGGERLRGGDTRGAVAGHDGQEHRGRRLGREQPRDAGEHRVVAAEDAAQQRSPREVDGERGGEAVERLRRVLRRGDGEDGVRQRVPSRGAAGGLRHAGGTRVEADHERVRARGSGGEHEAPVARSEVDRHVRAAIRAGGSDLAEVELVDPAAADDAEHDGGTGPARPAARTAERLLQIVDRAREHDGVAAPAALTEEGAQDALADEAGRGQRALGRLVARIDPGLHARDPRVAERPARQQLDRARRAAPPPRRGHDPSYEVFTASAERWPERKALSFFLTADTYQRASTWTYAELLAEITRAANVLHTFGVSADHPVAYVLPNLPETHFTIWGGEAAGVVLAVNPLLAPDLIVEILRAAKVRVLVTLAPFPGAELWSKLAPHLSALSEFVWSRWSTR